MGARDHILDIEFSTVTRVERRNPMVEVCAQSTQRLDISIEVAPDSILIAIGKLVGLCDCLVENIG
ncbi:hypothetical protein OGR47_03235 [Methylocystis sp. MJC1]|uniref:hypothetical protein n=1 Tax=Methylocystis sp. MJC1 TaxID=2654282 RepID=UPI0013EB3BBA|nr:hypothetical protein [Methylocystis sp. MJC1]MBU6526028.1 hypothetical protein [Methylocystis sp. MJC1]UZX12494.1 hypothetical protein OGR47_03235 [Methylocystis sp. MJC1]